jgi:hypothetical protein
VDSNGGYGDEVRAPGWWPESVRQVLRWGFPRSPVGRRGLHEDAVEGFRDYVARALEQADAERASLLAEIDRLHSYIRTQWAADAPAERDDDVPVTTPGEGQWDGCTRWSGSSEVVRQDGYADLPASPAGQALDVLAKAQAIADQRIAEAEARLHEAELRAAQAERRVESAEQRAGLAQEQARRCMAEADEALQQRWDEAEQEIATRRACADAEISRRLSAVEDDALRVIERAWDEYEVVLTRAHRRSEHAAQRALEDYHDETAVELSGPTVRAELEMKAAYLRTFGRASAAAQRSTLEVVRQELQRLTGPAVQPEQPVHVPAYRISASGDLIRLEIVEPAADRARTRPAAGRRPVRPLRSVSSAGVRVHSLPAALSAK